MVTFLNKPFYIDTSVCMHACNQLFYIQETQHCLFGFSELGSVFATNPRNSNLEEASNLSQRDVRPALHFHGQGHGAAGSPERKAPLADVPSWRGMCQ